MYDELNRLRKHYLEPKRNTISTIFFLLTLASAVYIWNQYVSPKNKYDEPANPSKLELNVNSNRVYATNISSSRHDTKD